MKRACVVAVMVGALIGLAPRGKADNAARNIAENGAWEHKAFVFNWAEKEQTSSAAKGHEREDNLPKWNEPSQWIFVIIAGITAIVVGWQAWETRKAAKAADHGTREMAGSVNLQRAAFSQWIELGNWRTRDPVFTEVAKHGTIEVLFDIINPTAFPLRIVKIETSNGALPPTVMNIPYRMPPKDCFTRTFNVTLTNTRFDENGGIVFSETSAAVICSVEYEDVLGDLNNQRFMYLCTLSTTGHKFIRFPEEAFWPKTKAEAKQGN